MRNYVESQARFRAAAFAFPGLRRVLKSWRFKRSCEELQAFDDAILHDMGLTRATLGHLLCLPWHVDPQWEYERLRLLASRRHPHRRPD
jgi:uncharacterized protein YjiS (DUF1127 family)